LKRIRVGLVLALVAAAGSCSLFDYSGMVTHKYALVYGVTRYIMAEPPAAYPNLGYPDADAKSVAIMLAAAGYTVHSRWIDSAGNVFVDGSPAGTINSPNPEAPSKVVIEADIKSLSSAVGPDDTFVFYFSGHGMPDTNPPTPPTHEWIVPYGGIIGSSGIYGGDPQSSIEDNEFGDILSASISTPRKVVILDTCNSGGFIGNKLETDITPAQYSGGTPFITPVSIAKAIANYAAFQSSPGGISPYNAQVLAAAGSNDSSWETADPPFSGHGVMTYYLLQTPSQADLNNDGHVTVLEAFAWVKTGIDNGWNSSALGSAFSPHISGGPVDFVLF
jgi:hypothetical protein